jgi:hypothetical protein
MANNCNLEEKEVKALLWAIEYVQAMTHTRIELQTARQKLGTELAYMERGDAPKHVPQMRRSVQT